MTVNYVAAIKASGLSIHDEIEIGDLNLWIPTPDLEAILQAALAGQSYAGLAIKTRSKLAKQQVCQALGYPVPNSFKRVQPRFRGQQFDTYVQQADNLQVWNEELEPARRYVLIRPDQNCIVRRVKVVNGEELALLDTTGTLTKKYQAQVIPGAPGAELIAASDTSHLAPAVDPTAAALRNSDPSRNPEARLLWPIGRIFDGIRGIVGKSFPDAGSIQERNRGAALHALVCDHLGYGRHRDDGRFPDVRHQLLEVKLQTSPTIDLGIVLPNSDKVLDIPKINGRQVQARDVRYAVFYGVISGGQVTITHLFLTTGERFFDRFTQFQGKVLNQKIQMHLPSDFFRH